MENQNTVANWALATFGRAPLLAVATRMNVEMAELLTALVEHAGLPSDDPLRLSLERNVAVALQLAQLASGVKDFGDDYGQSELTRQEAAGECADVFVMLLQVADRLGVELQERMEEKMAINRDRTWAKNAQGLTQHVEQTA